MTHVDLFGPMLTDFDLFLYLYINSFYILTDLLYIDPILPH